MNFYEACRLPHGTPLLLKETVVNEMADRFDQKNVVCTFWKVLGQSVVVQVLGAYIAFRPEELDRV